MNELIATLCCKKKAQKAMINEKVGYLWLLQKGLCFF